MTQDLLNEALVNITFSVMSAFGRWNTTVNGTSIETVNIYSFSRPEQFYLPYFIFLGLSLPALLLGFWSLRKNGVSAMDGSFIQLLTTMTGSRELERVAAGGCLGGWESCPTGLRDMKIRFGELKSWDEVDGVYKNEKFVRRAGFGTQDELVPLTQGALYGIVIGGPKS
jgi:hypothetical protein